jgi:glycosyltransferase involved in cell wall biosynthesis
MAGRVETTAAANSDAAGASLVAPKSFVLMLGTNPAMRGGIAAVVSALRDGGLFKRANVRYVATHVDGGKLAKLNQFASAVLSTIRALTSGQVALVHAHVSSNGSFWRKSFLLLMARAFGVPTIFHLHSGGFETYAARGLGGPLLRWWIRRTLEASDAVIVLSARWADWARRFAPKSNVRVVGNPVHVPAVIGHKHADEAQIGGRVLFLGLICDAKGAFDLLRAWVDFRASDPAWRLAVGGNGEVDRFLGEATRLGIRTEIEYLGWVSGAEKESQLVGADIFVLPSYGEGMPVSVLEAMAYGACVIATPVGGVPDMMCRDVHGLWVEPGDIRGLASCLRQLARSPAMRRALATAARDHVVAHFSLETTVERICDVYREAIERARAQHRPL